MKDQNTDITQISASIGLIEAAMTRVTNITAGLSGVIDIAASSFEQLNAQVTQFALSMSGIAEQPGFAGMLEQLTLLSVANEQAMAQLTTVNGAVMQLQMSVDAINTSINKSSEGTLGFVKSLADKVDMFTKLGPLYKGITTAINLLNTADKRHLVLVQASLVYLKLKKIAVAALNFVMNQNPISKIVAALGLLVGALKLAGVDFTKLGEKISKCWATIRSWFGAAEEASTAQEQLASSTGELSEANQGWADSLAEVASNTQSLAQVQQSVASAEVNNIGSQIAEQKELNKLKQEVNAKIPEKLPASEMPQLALGTSAINVDVSQLQTSTGIIEETKSSLFGLGEALGSMTGSWSVALSDMMEKSKPLDDLKSGFSSMATSMMGSLSQGADSLEEFAGTFGNSIREMIGGLLAQAVAFMVANAMQSVMAAGPFGFLLGMGLAAGAAGLAKSAFNSLVPKFANGGLVYGPTLGLMGEYAGAANNPEVIAPLSKLKSLIQPAGMGGGEVVFRIKGSDLEGVYNKRAQINRRTR